MSVRKGRMISDTLVVIGVVILLLGGFYDYKPLVIAGVIVAFSSLIPEFLFNRCPHCGKHLKTHKGEFCQYCGKRFDRDAPPARMSGDR